MYDDTVVLTDPVILSKDQIYGVTDLGLEGISSFFYKHEVSSSRNIKILYALQSCV